MNSLPKLIEDKQVRIKQVREFLAKEFPKDSLPNVDEARALASGHRAAMELFRTNEQRQVQEVRQKESREALQRKQQDRGALWDRKERRSLTGRRGPDRNLRLAKRTLVR